MNRYVVISLYINFTFFNVRSVLFIYYFVVNQLQDQTYVNNVNIQKIKEMETKYEMEKDYVEEKIKKGKIRKSHVIVESPT